MLKYIAFDLYKTNEHGGHQPAVVSSTGKREVYLAEDVDALVADLRSQLQAATTATGGPPAGQKS